MRVQMFSAIVKRGLIARTSPRPLLTTQMYCLKQRSLQLSTTSALKERLYSEKHEWVEIDGKLGTIGITDYAQEALGDVVYVQLPDIGAEFAKDDEVGAVESVKAASEVYTPLSGTIREVNTKLEEKPGLINKACYTDGWLFKLEYSKPDEIKSLMNEGAYQEYVKKAKDS